MRRLPLSRLRHNAVSSLVLQGSIAVTVAGQGFFLAPLLGDGTTKQESTLGGLPNLRADAFGDENSVALGGLPNLRADAFGDFGSKEATSEQSAQVSYERDGRGDVVSREVRCRDGRCIQQTRRVVMPQDKQLQQQRELQQRPPAASASRLVAGMSERMRGIDEIFRRSDAFDHRAPFWPWHSRIGTGDDILELRRRAGARGSGSEEEQEEVRSDSASESTETQMVNGHVIRRIKKCRNGRCVEEVEEGDTKTPDHAK